MTYTYTLSQYKSCVVPHPYPVWRGRIPRQSLPRKLSDPRWKNWKLGYLSLYRPRVLEPQSQSRSLPFHSTAGTHVVIVFVRTGGYDDTVVWGEGGRPHTVKSFFYVINHHSYVVRLRRHESGVTRLSKYLLWDAFGRTRPRRAVAPWPDSVSVPPNNVYLPVPPDPFPWPPSLSFTSFFLDPDRPVYVRKSRYT